MGNKVSLLFLNMAAQGGQRTANRLPMTNASKKKKYDELTQRLKPPSGPELKTADWTLTPAIAEAIVPIAYGTGADKGRLWTAQTCAAVVPVVNLPQIPQGPQAWARNGRQILLKKLAVNLMLTNTVVEAFQDLLIRVIFLIDFQSNGVENLNLSEVLKDSNDTGGTFFMSHRNMDNSTRFKTLVDETIRFDNRGRAYTFSADATPSTMWLDADNMGIQRQYYFRMNLPITYSGVTGDDSELTSNSIRCFIITATTQGEPFNGYHILPAMSVRCRYTDA